VLAGYNVYSVYSESAAFERLSRSHIDLIILDYRLASGRTGLDLFADLRSAGHQQPIIIVTGYGDETIVIDSLRAGVRDFVIKSSEYLQYLPLSVERVLEQVRLERRLAEADRQLRQAQKMEAIGKLAGGIAHEFNNLLQAIQGYTRFAMDGLHRDERRRKDLEQVLAASDRAATLTRRLLGFSRRELLQMADIDPTLLVRQLMEMVRPLLGEHISVHLHLADNVGLLHADAGLIQQMLMNLCVNARDAMPSGGTLTIKTEDANVSTNCCEFHPDLMPGRYLVLTVADTGCGMPPEIKNHLFEPFFTTKDIGQGTGLGLAMVYGTVQQHQGSIHVDSESGAGTTFKIYLPTVDHALVANHPPETPAARGGSETPTLPIERRRNLTRSPRCRYAPPQRPRRAPKNACHRSRGSCYLLQWLRPGNFPSRLPCRRFTAPHPQTLRSPNSSHNHPPSAGRTQCVITLCQVIRPSPLSVSM
jgi:signal transduction histidine kinase